MRIPLAAVLLVLLAASPALGQESEGLPKHGIVHKLLFYLPNRLFDTMDMVRLRARVGPGFGASARATRPLSAQAGFYSVVWAGLPGSRGRRTISLPAGFEALSGAQVSVIDVAADAGQNYGATEVGAGVHVFLLGADTGIDPLEVLDFIGGLVLIDFKQDDI